MRIRQKGSGLETRGVFGDWGPGGEGGQEWQRGEERPRTALRGSSLWDPFTVRPCLPKSSPAQPPDQHGDFQRCVKFLVSKSTVLGRSPTRVGIHTQRQHERPPNWPSTCLCPDVEPTLPCQRRHGSSCMSSLSFKYKFTLESIKSYAFVIKIKGYFN